MPKVKFDILESTCVPLPFENVDTDQIIPAQISQCNIKGRIWRESFPRLEI